jgi:hypothetical protein
MNLTATKNPAAASVDPVAPSLAAMRTANCLRERRRNAFRHRGWGRLSQAQDKDEYLRPNVFAAIGVALVEETARSFCSAFVECVATADFAEGPRAFRERRAAEFRGLSDVK